VLDEDGAVGAALDAAHLPEAVVEARVVVLDGRQPVALALALGGHVRRRHVRGTVDWNRMQGYWNFGIVKV
jgi:hypothetical protein